MTTLQRVRPFVESVVGNAPPAASQPVIPCNQQSLTNVARRRRAQRRRRADSRSVPRLRLPGAGHEAHIRAACCAATAPVSGSYSWRGCRCRSLDGRARGTSTAQASTGALQAQGAASYCNTLGRRVQTFNALVGVYLQAVPEEFCGNLVVFPGSHMLVAEATRDASTMELLRREGTPTPNVTTANP